MPRERGIHEILITEAIRTELAALGGRLGVEESALRSAEAADRIALHLSRIVQRTLDDVPDPERVAHGVALARRILTEIGAADDAPVEPGTLLRALLARLPDGTPEVIERPLVPLLDTTILTNAPGEPRVGRQLLAEVDSADRVDVVMAFVRMSGIRPLLDALRRHHDAGRPLRVLTTTYTGSTEARALDALQAVGADARVSYDTTSTRLHAKGVAVPPGLRLLHRVHRVVEPDPFGAGVGPRVERTGVGRAEPRGDRQDRVGVRELLRKSGLRAVRRGGVREAGATGEQGGGDPPVADRGAAGAVPGAVARADRTVAGTRASPEPPGLGDGHRKEDRLLHRSHVLNIRGRSYRLRELEERSDAAS